MTDKDKNMGTLTFGSGSNLLTGVTVRPGIHAWIPQKGNFGPELGFNWSPVPFKNKLVVRGGYGLNYNQEQIANANANDGNPPGASYLGNSSPNPMEINPFIVYAVSSSPTNAFGYPANPHAITTFNSAGLPTIGGANLSALPHHMPTQYTQHFSLDMEYDLGHSLIANLGYEGSLGRHLLYSYDATALADIVGAAQNPLINSVGTFGSGGWSNNHMMLAGLKHQFAHTFSAEAQFTWAHSMDTNSGPYSRDTYIYNPGYSVGRSDFDINKSFKLFGVWQPVLFRGEHNWAEKVAGGWTLSGIMTLHSGFGWTPVYNIGSDSIYCNTCNYQYSNLRPIYLGGGGKSTSNNAFKTGSNFPIQPPGTTPNDYFLDSYFKVPNFSNALTNNPGQSTTTFVPPPGIDRNSFPGPGYRDVDFTFAKAFGLPNMKVIGENAKIEIKANMINAFNLLNITPTSLSTNISSSNLGQASSALGARVIDIQARFSF